VLITTTVSSGRRTRSLITFRLSKDRNYHTDDREDGLPESQADDVPFSEYVGLGLSRLNIDLIHLVIRHATSLKHVKFGGPINCH